MGKYLQERERYTIEALLKEGFSPAYIADRLGRCRATIYNEINRGKVEHMDRYLRVKKAYDAYAGQRVREERSHNKGAPLKLGNDLQYVRAVEHLILNEHYSPYACTVYISKNHPEIATHVCTVTLYSYIYKGLFLHVSRSDLPYKKHAKKRETEPRVPLNHRGGKSIDERPKTANSRKSVGHWEMDTVVSGQGKSLECLLALTDRKSRLEIVRRVSDKRAATVVAALDRFESDMGSDRFFGLFTTITTDNGCEFLDADGITKSLNGHRRTELYYCHPYRSGERGSNENQNRMIRRWVPKGSDISQYTDDYIAHVQDWLNDYPRKMFGGLSAREVFEREYFNTS